MKSGVSSTKNRLTIDVGSSTAYRKLGVALCAAVVLTASFVFLFRLGEKPFWDYDEATYANVIQDTLHSPDVLTLKLGTTPWFNKPPLSFWLSMGLDSVIHHPESSYRLTAALAGLISVVLVMAITYEITGNLLVAAIAGLILLTMGSFLQSARELRQDVPAAAMVLLSVYAFLKGLRTPMWLMGVGISLALGLMFKSIFGLLGVPFIFFWSLLYRDFSWLKNRYVWIGGGLFFLILAPWHIYESLQYGQAFWNEYFLSNIFTRYRSDVIGGSTTTANYLTFFLTYAAPWTSVFVILLGWLSYNYKKFRDEPFRPIFVCSITAAFLFVLFLSSSTKILPYLITVYPFVAITLALCFGYGLQAFRNNKMLLRILFGAVFGLTVFAFWVTINFGFHIFPYIAVNDVIVKEEKEVADIIVQQPQTLDVYSYQYNYFDTIEYYSRRRQILTMQDDQSLDQSFLLLVGKEYMDWHAFPEELQAHLQTLYKGQSLILYKFNP